MCTAITFHSKDHYFGRNLDVAHSYGEAVTITPQNFPFHFLHSDSLQNHHAIIGMALVENGYPLYFDGTNECGLSMAGLDFPGNAVYHPFRENRDNIAPFELIPWILGQAKSVSDAISLLDKINIVRESFSDRLPLTPMHWLLADRERSIVIEPLADGIKIYDNPQGVLTNNPPFAYHQLNIQNYLNLTSANAENRFSPKFSMLPCSYGMGAFGLPGDLSSPSRFIRAAFVSSNALPKPTEEESVGQFFHILDAVFQPEGCAAAAEGWNKTVYSSCCNTEKLIYYYHTYTNRQIVAVQLRPEHLQSQKLVCYPLVTKEQIRREN